MNLLSTAPVTYRPPLEPYISLLHSDADILVFDKPSGLLSVPGAHPALQDSLLTRARKEFPDALIIHRLDKDTSGVILMSRHRKAHAFVAAQFAARTTIKSYVADVWGRVTDEEGIIDLPLAIDPENKPRHRVDPSHGKHAQTRWKVLHYGHNRTRVRLFPVTGRTHQLRVHMKTLGHVILGDELYADGFAFSSASRLMLHAEELSFLHPNGAKIAFNAATPF